MQHTSPRTDERQRHLKSSPILLSIAMQPLCLKKKPQQFFLHTAMAFMICVPRQESSQLITFKKLVINILIPKPLSSLHRRGSMQLDRQRNASQVDILLVSLLPSPLLTPHPPWPASQPRKISTSRSAQCVSCLPLVQILFKRFKRSDRVRQTGQSSPPLPPRTPRLARLQIFSAKR